MSLEKNSETGLTLCVIFRPDSTSYLSFLNFKADLSCSKSQDGNIAYDATGKVIDSTLPTDHGLQSIQQYQSTLSMVELTC
jgi:hypothetical protein